MVVSTFSILNKDYRLRLFKKNFLLAKVKPDIDLEIPFLPMSNADIDFQAQDIQQRSYIIENMLPTTRKVELIGKKEFAVAILNLDYKRFIIYIPALNINSDTKVHPSKRAQIAHSNVNEAPTKVFSKYINFAIVFLLKLIVKLSKYIGINKYAIKLVNK